MEDDSVSPLCAVCQNVLSDGDIREEVAELLEEMFVHSVANLTRVFVPLSIDDGPVFGPDFDHIAGYVGSPLMNGLRRMARGDPGDIPPIKDALSVQMVLLFGIDISEVAPDAVTAAAELLYSLVGSGSRLGGVYVKNAFVGLRRFSTAIQGDPLVRTECVLDVVLVVGPARDATPTMGYEGGEEHLSFVSGPVFAALDDLLGSVIPQPDKTGFEQNQVFFRRIALPYLTWVSSPTRIEWRAMYRMFDTETVFGRDPERSERWTESTPAPRVARLWRSGGLPRTPVGTALSTPELLPLSSPVDRSHRFSEAPWFGSVGGPSPVPGECTWTSRDLRNRVWYEPRPEPPSIDRSLPFCRLRDTRLTSTLGKCSEIVIPGPSCVSRGEHEDSITILVGDDSTKFEVERRLAIFKRGELPWNHFTVATSDTLLPLPVHSDGLLHDAGTVKQLTVYSGWSAIESAPYHAIIDLYLMRFVSMFRQMLVDISTGTFTPRGTSSPEHMILVGGNRDGELRHWGAPWGRAIYEVVMGGDTNAAERVTGATTFSVCASEELTLATEYHSLQGYVWKTYGSLENSCYDMCPPREHAMERCIWYSRYRSWILNRSANTTSGAFVERLVDWSDLSSLRVGLIHRTCDKNPVRCFTIDPIPAINEALSPYNISVELVDLPSVGGFAAQVNYVAQLDVMLGIIGSGQQHAMWMPTNALVVSVGNRRLTEGKDTGKIPPGEAYQEDFIAGVTTCFGGSYVHLHGLAGTMDIGKIYGQRILEAILEQHRIHPARGYGHTVLEDYEYPSGKLLTQWNSE